MGTKPGVFVDGSQSTLIMASYLNDLRTLCYELAGDGTNAPATKAAVRSNLGATAIGDALITAATAAAARGTLGSTVTGDALFVAATQAAAQAVLGLVPGSDVQAYAATASQAEMIAGTEAALRALSPLRIRQAIEPHTTTAIALNSVQSVSIAATTRRIEVGLWNVSTTGTANVQAVLTSANIVRAQSTCSSITAAAVANTYLSTGILLLSPVVAADGYMAKLYLTNSNNDNIHWFTHHTAMRYGAAHSFVGNGFVEFSVSEAHTLTFSCGGDTFDGGLAWVAQYNWP